MSILAVVSGDSLIDHFDLKQALTCGATLVSGMVLVSSDLVSPHTDAARRLDLSLWFRAGDPAGVGYVTGDPGRRVQVCSLFGIEPALISS